MGSPRVLICDNATTFCGPHWDDVTHVFDVNLILSPTKAAYQIGVAERAVGLLKNGFRDISRFEEGKMSKELRLSLTCIARNSTPLSGVELSPLMLTTGRDDIAGKLPTASHNHAWITDEGLPMASHFRRLTAVALIRAEIITWDAKNMIQMALSKNIRKGAADSFAIDMPIQVWNRKLSIWGEWIPHCLRHWGQYYFRKRKKIIETPSSLGAQFHSIGRFGE